MIASSLFCGVSSEPLHQPQLRSGGERFLQATPPGCESGCTSHYCSKGKEKDCTKYDKDLGKNKVESCNNACGGGGGGGGGGSSCPAQTPVIPAADSTAATFCPATLENMALTDPVDPAYVAIDIGCDAGTGAGSGRYVCHDPNPGKVYPRTMCVALTDSPPAGAKCGWCCIDWAGTVPEPVADSTCTANPCTDDDGIAGYQMCANNGGKPGKDKLADKCVATDDADHFLQQFYKTTCGCCGGECPMPCSQSSNAAQCDLDDGGQGYFVCKKGKTICVPDGDTLALQEKGSTCGCCGGVCPTPCDEVTDASTCTLEDGITVGYEMCHNVLKNPVTICVAADESVDLLKNHAGNYCLTDPADPANPTLPTDTCQNPGCVANPMAKGCACDPTGTGAGGLNPCTWCAKSKVKNGVGVCK
jgi:hypothetical protein